MRALAERAVRYAGPAGHHLVFDLAKSNDGKYEVYYLPGEAGAGRDESPKSAKGDSIILKVYAIEEANSRIARRLENMINILREAEPVGPPVRRPQIDDCVNPLGRSDHYIAVYQGFLECDTTGVYSFGIDADDHDVEASRNHFFEHALLVPPPQRIMTCQSQLNADCLNA